MIYFQILSIAKFYNIMNFTGDEQCYGINLIFQPRAKK